MDLWKCCKCVPDDYGDLLMSMISDRGGTNLAPAEARGSGTADSPTIDRSQQLEADSEYVATRGCIKT